MTHGHKRKTASRKEINSECYGKVIQLQQYDSTSRYPRDVIKFSSEKQSSNNLHPTQKPVSLCEYFIKTYSNENDVILDFTMGSGTTGIACLNTNRKFIGIEKDDKYFELANQRMKQHQNQLVIQKE